MNHQCRMCEQNIEVDAVFVGLPIIQMRPFLRSDLTGNEVLFHIACFLSVFKKLKLEIVS